MSAFSLVPVVVLLVVVALGVGAVALVGAMLRGRGDVPPAPATDDRTAGQAVRRFFQYLLLLGLLFSAASGVSGLLGRLLSPGTTLVRDDAGLALQLTFTLIALPLWGALAWWTDRRLRQDPTEARSLGWAACLTVTGLVSLVVALVAWRATLAAAVGAEDYRGSQLATALVWTLVWAGHRWWGGRAATPEGHLRLERLLGSLVALVTAVSGAVLVLTPALRELLGLTRDSLVGGATQAILEGACVLVVGAAAWTAYWLLGTRRGPRGTGWLALVLLAGVAGGLLLAVWAASVLGYDVLVWLVGDPRERTAAEHFADAPGLLASILVGLTVWWYHREVLEAGRAPGRTEVRRVYEYVLAAVGLLAAGSGLVMVLVTVVEAVAAGADLVVGGDALNALLAALVLLAVGLPVWWWHWRQAQRARATEPAPELASLTRRTYLLVLFGLMGVVAVVALLTLVYLVLDDALSGGVDLETLRRVRFPFGILATTALLSAYHWTVFRADRDAAAAAPPAATDGPAETRAGSPDAPRPPRSVLLVGPADPLVAEDLARRTGATVQLVRRADVAPAPWSLDELVAAVSATGHDDVLVLAEPDGLRVVPVRR